MRSSAALKCLPSAADGVSITFGDNWTYSAWVEISSSAPANSVLAGVVMFTGSWSNQEAEIEIGIGAAASEVGISSFRDYLSNSGNGRGSVYLLPLPVSGIAGQRVSVRGRASVVGPATKIAVLYLDNPNNQITTTKKFSNVPAGADGVTVTPNGTAYAWSNWFELTSGIGTPIGVVGISNRNFTGSPDCEYQLGTGAGGAEVALTAIRQVFSAFDNSQSWTLYPGIYLLPVSTRVAVRIRKSGTSTATIKVALLYYADLSAPGNSGGAGAGKGSKGNKGGGGVTILTPGSPILVSLNPGVDMSSV